MAVPAFVTVERARVVVVVLCALQFVLGLLVVTGLALSSSGTGGRCLLYMDKSGFGPISLCSYVYTVITLLQLLYCLARAVLLALILAHVLKKKDLLGNKYVLIGCSIVDAVAWLLTSVSGGIITHGFSVMCSKVFYPRSDRCGALDIYSAVTSSFIKNYYTGLNIAQAGLWISWFVWILLLAVDVFQLWEADLFPQLRKATNFRSSETGNEAIRRDKNTNQSQRSAVVLLRGGDSDTDSGPRTPPPRRPVPPAPAAAARPLRAKS